MNKQTTSPPVERTSAGGLRKLAMKGAFWEMVGLVIRQGLRFGSNLILTRLLFPEAFGLAALVTVFNYGLVMLSDLGIGPAVVQSEKGDDIEFLNTAWTMQVMRGGVMFIIAALLCYPAAVFFDKPELGPMLLAGSTVVLLAGTNSTSLLTIKRKVDARRGMMVELGAYLVSLAVLIPMAWITRSVWALVVAPIVGALSTTLISHFVIDVGYRNRLVFSKLAAESIGKFGRWIFLASACQFFAMQYDRMFMARVLGFHALGIFTVAAALAELGNNIIDRIAAQVLFPVLSLAHRENSTTLRKMFYHARFVMGVALLPFLGAAVVIAPWLIHTLYDSRYESAGWMLQILLVQVALRSVTTPSWTYLFSIGRAKYVFLKSVLRFAWMATALPLAYKYFALPGLVWAIALAEVPTLILVAPVLWKEKIVSPLRELEGPLYFGGGYLIAELIRRSFFGG